MPEKIRIGILGGGGILVAHAPAYQKLQDRCTVVAVAEPETKSHARIRELVGDQVRLCADYHDLLAMNEVDAVDIILPHSLHLPATLAAAGAGKPVLVEKVMARNVEECDRMIEACDRAGVSLTICHDHRYHGQWMALKEVVESGCLGEIFYWKLDHNQNVLVPEGHWIRSSEHLGGGAIMSCLTHQIDALRWFGGEVASVTCMMKVLPDRMEGETLGVIAARMASGALAQLSINWFTRSSEGPNALWYEMAQVCGTGGEAYFMHGKGTFVRLHSDPTGAGVERWGSAAMAGYVPVPAGEWTGHERCIAEWVNDLRGEQARIVTRGRDVRGTVEVAEAAYQSAQTSRTVNLPL